MIVILLDERSPAVEFSGTVLAISVGSASRIAACHRGLPLSLALMVLVHQVREVLSLGFLNLNCALLPVLSRRQGELVVCAGIRQTGLHHALALLDGLLF